MAERSEDSTLLIATWPDGFKWEIPDTEGDNARLAAVTPNALWTGDSVRVNVVSKAGRQWLQIWNFQEKKQVSQLVGYTSDTWAKCKSLH